MTKITIVSFALLACATSTNAQTSFLRSRLLEIESAYEVMVGDLDKAFQGSCEIERFLPDVPPVITNQLPNLPPWVNFDDSNNVPPTGKYVVKCYANYMVAKLTADNVVHPTPTRIKVCEPTLSLPLSQTEADDEANWECDTTDYDGQNPNLFIAEALKPSFGGEENEN